MVNVRLLSKTCEYAMRYDTTENWPIFQFLFLLLFLCAIIYILFIEALFPPAATLCATRSTFELNVSCRICLNERIIHSMKLAEALEVGVSATNDLLFSPQFRNNKIGCETATATLSQESSSRCCCCSDPDTLSAISVLSTNMRTGCGSNRKRRSQASSRP